MWDLKQGLKSLNQFLSQYYGKPFVTSSVTPLSMLLDLIASKLIKKAPVSPFVMHIYL